MNNRLTIRLLTGLNFFGAMLIAIVTTIYLKENHLTQSVGMPFLIGLFLGGLIGMPVWLFPERILAQIEDILQNKWSADSAQWMPRPLQDQLAELNQKLSEYTTAEEVQIEQIRTTSQQEERNRLARELHDSIKQQIFAVRTSALSVSKLWDKYPEKAYSALQDVLYSADSAMLEMDSLLAQMKPITLEMNGLLQAIEEQCETLGLRTGAYVRFTYDEEIDQYQLNQMTTENLFRIVQEGFANIAKHARATLVMVNLTVSPTEHPPTLALSIVDDGNGFNSAEKKDNQGMGMNNMTYRTKQIGGTFSIESTPANGTQLVVEHIPCQLHKKAKTPYTDQWATEQYTQWVKQSEKAGLSQKRPYRFLFLYLLIISILFIEWNPLLILTVLTGCVLFLLNRMFKKTPTLPAPTIPYTEQSKWIHWLYHAKTEMKFIQQTRSIAMIGLCTSLIGAYLAKADIITRLLSDWITGTILCAIAGLAVVSIPHVRTYSKGLSLAPTKSTLYKELTKNQRGWLFVFYLIVMRQMMEDMTNMTDFNVLSTAIYPILYVLGATMCLFMLIRLYYQMKPISMREDQSNE